MSSNGAPAGPVAPNGVNHLVLNVRNIERSHDFYTRILGFHQVGELEQRPGRPMKMRFYSGGTGSHHDLALVEVADPAAADEPAPWSMMGRAPGINHFAVHWPDQDAWLKQVAWMQGQGVTFHRRVDHGMTHSVYISDPDGHGIEVLYELEREVWQGDVNAALNYAKNLPTEGDEVLVESEIVRFGEPATATGD